MCYTEETVEKEIEITQILFQDPIVHPARKQSAAGHQEKLLHRIGERAQQIVRKGRAADIIKAVLLPGIGEGGRARLRGEHTGSKQRGITATGNIQCTARTFLADSQKLL